MEDITHGHSKTDSDNIEVDILIRLLEKLYMESEKKSIFFIIDQSIIEKINLSVFVTLKHRKSQGHSCLLTGHFNGTPTKGAMKQLFSNEMTNQHVSNAFATIFCKI